MSRRKQAKPRALLKSNTMVEEQRGTDEGIVQGPQEEDGIREDGLPSEDFADIYEDEEEEMLSGSDSDTMGLTDASSSCSFSENGELDSSPGSASQDVEVTFTIGPTESTPYSCQFCEKAFPRLSYLKKHEQTHSDQMPFKCDFCQRLFKHKRSRDRHVKLHTGDKKYRCPHCESAFSRSDHLKIHLKTHDHAKPYQCVICNRGYNTAAALTSHMQNHKKPTNSSSSSSSTPSSPHTYRCLTCNAIFPTPEELQGHNHDNEPKVSSTPTPPTQPLSCPHCDERLPTLESLQLHIQAIHLTHSCSLCNAKFPSLTLLQKHILTGHNLFNPPSDVPTDLSKKQQNTLICNVCSAGFADFEGFRTHLKTHLEKKMLKCDICDGEFSTQEELEGHAIGHYVSSTVTEYGCSSCLKMFSKPDELQKHLLDIHAVHLYRCSLCKEVFDSKVSIQVHFAVKHSNECKLFRCSGCSGVFRSEVEFQLHVRLLHLKPNSLLPPQPTPPPQQISFRCLLCPGPNPPTFSTPLDLHLHTTTAHYCSSAFRCTLCDESFPVEFLLDKHMSTHEKKEPVETDRKDNTTDKKSSNKSLSLSCAYCSNGTSFKTRNELEHHMKSHQSMGKNKCNICDQICPTAGLLAEHKLSHCRVQINKCIKCGEEIKSESGFLGHVTMCHGSMDYPMACIICRQTVGSSLELHLHAKFHTSSNSSTSTPCSSSSSTSPPLKLSTNKTYQCIKCQMSFTSEEEIQSHVTLNHLQSDTNTCHLCRMSFESPLKLQIHLIEHTFEGISSYSCYICSSVFTSAVGLQGHMLEGHGLGARPYDCQWCRVKFFFRAELENHLIISHGLSSNGSSSEEKQSSPPNKRKSSGKRSSSENNNNNSNSNSSSSNKKKRKFFYRDDSDDEGGEGEGREPNNHNSSSTSNKKVVEVG